MTSTARTTGTASRPALRHAPWLGLGAALLLVAAAVALPRLTGWDVHARDDDGPSLAPLHGYWQPKVGIGTAPAVLLALLGWRYATGLADRLRWRPLLATAYAGGLAGVLALALVGGRGGVAPGAGGPDA